MKTQDSKNCESSNHANIDVFVVQHSPRLVVAEDKLGRCSQRRVVTTDIWRFWQPSGGKGKDQDWFAHNKNLDHIIDYYTGCWAKRAQMNGTWNRPGLDDDLPPIKMQEEIKRVLIWTDGCPGQ